MYKLKRQTNHLISSWRQGIHRIFVLPCLVTLFTLITWLYLGQAFAQEQSKIIDSLLAVLETAKEDTNKAITLYELCWHNRTIDQEIALKYCDQALNLSKQLDFQKGIAYSLTKSGVVYRIHKNYEKAIEYLQQGLKVSKETGFKKGIAFSSIEIALAYHYQGKYEKAIDHYFKSLKIYNELDNKYGIVNCSFNLGSIYSNQGKYGQAVEYYMQSLNVYNELLKHSVKVDDINSNNKSIALNLKMIGNVYSKQDIYEKSIEFFNKSLKIYEKLGNGVEMANCLNNIGDIYGKQSNFDKSINYFQQALDIYTNLKDKEEGISLALGNIGEMYYKQEKYEKAIEYCNKSLEHAKEIDDQDIIKWNYEILIETYTKQNDSKNADRYKKLLSEL